MIAALVRFLVGTVALLIVEASTRPRPPRWASAGFGILALLYLEESTRPADPRAERIADGLADLAPFWPPREDVAA